LNNVGLDVFNTAVCIDNLMLHFPPCFIMGWSITFYTESVIEYRD